MKRGKSRRLFKKKKSHSNQRLGCIIAIIVLIPICYGLYLYYQQYSVQHSSKPQIETSVSLPTPSGKDLEIPVSLIPRQEQIIRHKGYTVSYNKDLKIPNWVSYELTRQETKGKEKRGDNFIADPLVKGAIATNADYARSGYDKGHMAPAADMKWSKQAMAESFYMSNICPQNPNLNRGDWNDLEEKSRQWAKKYGAVYIACGPVYDHGKPKRIGNNKVAVPDAFYKVILINDSKTPQAIGFLFPNKAGHKPLKKYIVTVDSVEKRTGIDFFPALPDEVENRIEAEPAKALP